MNIMEIVILHNFAFIFILFWFGIAPFPHKSRVTSHCHFISFFVGFQFWYFFFFFVSADRYSFHLLGWNDSVLKCTMCHRTRAAHTISLQKNKCNFSVLLILIHENFRIMIIMLIIVYLFIYIFSHCNKIQINCGIYNVSIMQFSIRFNSIFVFCIHIESVFRFVCSQITRWKWKLTMQLNEKNFK